MSNKANKALNWVDLPLFTGMLGTRMLYCKDENGYVHINGYVSKNGGKILYGEAFAKLPRGFYIGGYIPAILAFSSGGTIFVGGGAVYVSGSTGDLKLVQPIYDSLYDGAALYFTNSRFYVG